MLKIQLNLVSRTQSIKVYFLFGFISTVPKICIFKSCKQTAYLKSKVININLWIPYFSSVEMHSTHISDGTGQFNKWRRVKKWISSGCVLHQWNIEA